MHAHHRSVLPTILYLFTLNDQDKKISESLSFTVVRTLRIIK